VAAVPALAFLSLTKLVLSRTPAQQPAPPAGTPTGEVAQADPGPPSPEPLPPELLTGARMAVYAHQQATGQPITTESLASHLAIPPALAGQLLHVLDDTAASGTPSPVTAVNGTSHPAGGRL